MDEDILTELQNKYNGDNEVVMTARNINVDLDDFIPSHEKNNKMLERLQHAMEEYSKIKYNDIPDEMKEQLERGFQGLCPSICVQEAKKMSPNCIECQEQ